MLFKSPRVWALIREKAHKHQVAELAAFSGSSNQKKADSFKLMYLTFFSYFLRHNF